MSGLWPALPPPVGITPMAVDVLVALPVATSAWGRGHWGQSTWGGYEFDTPTPMDCDVEGIDIERGRTDPLDHVSAGGIRLTLQDPERKWSPWVVPPNGFRSWRTGTPIQIRSPEGHLFTGVVTEIHASEKPEADFQRSVDVVALDPLTFLAVSDAAAQADQGANELAGARLERVWANALPPVWVEHDFDPGVARMQPTTLARPALEEAWLTADSDAGMLTCTPDGVVRYWDTQRGLTDDRRVVPQVTFTDDDDYGKGWTPADIRGLVVWLDASRLALTDGDPVATWPDASGRGHHATAVVTPPTYHAGAVGVGPSVGFSSAPVTPMHVAGLGTALAGLNAYTLVVLLKPTAAPGAMNVLLTAPTDDVWRFLIEFTDTYFDWGHGGGASYFGYTTPIPAGTEQLWTFAADAVGARHDLYQNGAHLAAFTDWGYVPGPIPQLGPDMLLGANFVHNAPMAAEVAAVLLYDHAITDAERQQVEGYLQGEWTGTAPTTPPVVCTTKFDVVDDQAPVINWVGIAAAGGTQQVATDEASISYYGRRSTHRNDLVHAEGDGFSAEIAHTFLTRVTRNAVVVSPLVFDALASPEAWAAAHSLDVGDRVAVHRAAAGERLDITAAIDQISHRITPYAWETTVKLAPGTQRTAYPRWGSARWGVDHWS